MTFTPAIPLTGFAGWRVFNESADRQFEAFKSTATIIRDVEYFKENIANATTPEDLVKDRRLLTVALGAFGLEEEINKKAFIRRMLDEGTDNQQSFANKLADSRWKDFVKGFPYGNLGGVNLSSTTFQEKIADQYMERTFEARVGDVNTDMRLAMNFRREAARIAQGSAVETAGWFQIMGQKPLRAVVEGAFGLPTEFGTIDIDQQKVALEQKASSLFGSGSPTIFNDPEVVEAVIRRYFLQREIQEGPGPTTRGMGAISMLTATPSSATQSINLLLSNLG